VVVRLVVVVLDRPAVVVVVVVFAPVLLGSVVDVVVPRPGAVVLVDVEPDDAAAVVLVVLVVVEVPAGAEPELPGYGVQLPPCTATELELSVVPVGEPKPATTSLARVTQLPWVAW
jgi:hypothetical protein